MMLFAMIRRRYATAMKRDDYKRSMQLEIRSSLGATSRAWLSCHGTAYDDDDDDDDDVL